MPAKKARGNKAKKKTTVKRQQKPTMQVPAAQSADELRYFEERKDAIDSDPSPDGRDRISQR